MGQEKKIYFTLLFIRFLFIFSYGYIHPDEFFQGPEVVTSNVFEIETTIPWEFASNEPIRTIITPYIIILFFKN